VSQPPPGIPPDVWRQANEIADALWADIEKTARGSDADPVQLERIKPMVLEALRIAVGRGALVSVTEGLKLLEESAKQKRRQQHN